MSDLSTALKSAALTLIMIVLAAGCLGFLIVKTSLKSLYKWPITALVFITVLFLFDPNLPYMAVKTIGQDFVSDPTNALKSLSVLFWFCIVITWLAIFIKEVVIFDETEIFKRFKRQVE